MKKFVFKIFIFTFFGFWLFSYNFVLAYNERVSACPNDICTAVTDDLPDRATGIDPNTRVNLGFGVYQRSTQLPPVCEGNKSLFYALRRYTARSGDDYEYISSGDNSPFIYEFNSGQYGQRHRYAGVFYCWTRSLEEDKSAVNDMFKNKSSQGQDQAWLTPLFDQTTRMAPRLPVETTSDGGSGTENTSRTVSLDFSNPLQAENFNDLIETIMNWLRIIVLPVAVIVIVVSGIVMMYAGADAGKFNSAKKALLWAVVGLAVILIGEGFTKLIESIINLKNR